MELCSISVKQKSDTQDIESDSEDEDIDEQQPLSDDLLSIARGNDSQKQHDPIFALPLYSLLPAEQQRRVFEPPPEGHRMVVISTNVAETSLTIPDVRYVVDTGKEKVKRYNFASGASWFEVVWVSQASAEQRAGRAGRVGPGRCFRLYSARVFGDMDKFLRPDILTRPIDDVVLMLKSYLGPTPLHRFPLPTSPSFESIQSAQQRLLALGALQISNFGPKRGFLAIL
ncbi:ATP-dependent RNA helicase dhx37 [Cichlidogyrus casuarinus]|uniref:ATP-dependent RNA helicase dhx37 n=1 Tax=Cichlidogyrus casuarinus TaxID=1844966 RepID=A0ABD2QM09_9PLAT